MQTGEHEVKVGVLHMTGQQQIWQESLVSRQTSILAVGNQAAGQWQD